MSEASTFTYAVDPTIHAPNCGDTHSCTDMNAYGAPNEWRVRKICLDYSSYCIRALTCPAPFIAYFIFVLHADFTILHAISRRFC